MRPSTRKGDREGGKREGGGREKRRDGRGRERKGEIGREKEGDIMMALLILRRPKLEAVGGKWKESVAAAAAPSVLSAKEGLALEVTYCFFFFHEGGGLRRFVA